MEQQDNANPTLRKLNFFSLTNWVSTAMVLLLVMMFLIAMDSNALCLRSGNATIASEWILDKTVDNVDFYHQVSECNGEKIVFLKFDNRNKFNVKISWKEVFSTQAGSEQEGFKGQKELVLSPGVTSQTDCDIIEKRECLVLPLDVSPAYRVIISKFEYRNISVSRGR